MERTLTLLLHRRSARAALRARDFAALGLAGPDHASTRAAFAAVDLDELDAAAALLRRELVTRRHRGTGGLTDWYPRTIAAWSASLDELVAAFLESPASVAWREVAHDAPGQCLEEAFYRFACAAELGDEVVREDEWLTAQLRALALVPSPAFVVPGELRPAVAGGWFAVAAHAPVLYAAVRARFLRGPVTPGLARWLRSGEGELPGAVRAQLAELGLVELATTGR
jgi:hypothetical protein